MTLEARKERDAEQMREKQLKAKAKEKAEGAGSSKSWMPHMLISHSNHLASSSSSLIAHQGRR